MHHTIKDKAAVWFKHFEPDCFYAHYSPLGNSPNTFALVSPHLYDNMMVQIRTSVTYNNERGGCILLKWWKNFMNRLGESNRKEFGGKRLDCCSINRENSK